MKKPATVKTLEWERVPSSSFEAVHRAKVPGGWLVVIENGHWDDNRCPTAAVYVPDPGWTWEAGE